METFDRDALKAYETAAQDPDVVAAWCADYAAAGDIDVQHDTADLGRTIDVPALILWGSKGVVGAQTDPLAAWREWLPRVTGQEIQAGHFLVEEATPEVLNRLQQHLATAE